ncbi:thiamine diphosphokinase [Paenibacillus campi]|uniref:thiamine diphosphokinase n=1 Tax=Paenibacillus campi TaxID=3106031 RepID=UPI002B002911|nr:thiamine diphosphokinase [Paenibacillus sp. SGZ-1009]
MAAKRALIFSGGLLHPDFLLEIREDDLVIGADRGALFLIQHGVNPQLAIGDFDSLQDQETELEQIRQHAGELIVYDPVDKDVTDTEAAFEAAMERQINEIVIFGALGSRFDHSIANVQLLIRALQHQVHCVIQDMNNYISLTSTTSVIHNQGYPYISLLPITSEVTGIHLTGFQYPLENATLRMGQSRGISNHLAEPQGTVSIEGGLLLIVQSRD